MNYYLGIDIGGTNLRAAILDNEYNLIDKLEFIEIVSFWEFFYKENY